MDTVLIKFALQLLDHVKSIRLSKEVPLPPTHTIIICVQGKAKAVRNRAKVNATLEKLAHAQRQEAAQQRREDKAKAAKEKMLAETDPDKQRKMEVCMCPQCLCLCVCKFTSTVFVGEGE